MKAQNLSLYHLIREPKIPSEKAPVAILLHGYGSNEEDLFGFADELPEELFVISVRAPLHLQPYGYAWYAIYWDNSTGKFSNDEQAKTSRDAISNFIDEALATYPIDPDNLSLIGFSQGTILSLAVALSYPEKVKNVVGLSGYVHPEILKEGFETKEFSRLSIYSSYGTMDEVIPVEWARKTKPFLDRLKIKNTYSEFPVGHGVAPQNLLELKTWLKNNI